LVLIYIELLFFFCSKLNAIFKVVKMNFGSEVGAWVSFHTDILLSLKFQENLGQTVLALPLLAQVIKRCAVAGFYDSSDLTVVNQKIIRDIQACVICVVSL